MFSLLHVWHEYNEALDFCYAVASSAYVPDFALVFLSSSTGALRSNPDSRFELYEYIIL